MLETLLALCEPPGWDLSPPQRLGRRNATANALRLWSLLDQAIAHERAAVHGSVARPSSADAIELDVDGTSAAWHWDLWRHGAPRDAAHGFQVRMRTGNTIIEIDVRLEDAPSLVRNLQVRRGTLASHEANELARAKPVPGRAHLSGAWRFTPSHIPMAYPQARALIAALVFRAGGVRVRLGPQP